MPRVCQGISSSESAPRASSCSRKCATCSTGRAGAWPGPMILRLRSTVQRSAHCVALRDPKRREIWLQGSPRSGSSETITSVGWAPGPTTSATTDSRRRASSSGVHGPRVNDELVRLYFRRTTSGMRPIAAPISVHFGPCSETSSRRRTSSSGVQPPDVVLRTLCRTCQYSAWTLRSGNMAPSSPQRPRAEELLASSSKSVSRDTS
mmetsp:Transcript_15898/g.46736  ORF Transcript_15898/g.46736 Transcript_15898/m.46736 type:complete len:206 (-) Transcript_15898:152-769(-)